MFAAVLDKPPIRGFPRHYVVEFLGWIRTERV